MTLTQEDSELDRWYVTNSEGTTITNLVQAPSSFGLAVLQLSADQELFGVHPLRSPSLLNAYGRTNTFILTMEPPPLNPLRGGDFFFEAPSGDRVSCLS